MFYKPFANKNHDVADYPMKSSSSKRSEGRPVSGELNFGSTKRKLDQDDMEDDVSMELSPNSKLVKFHKKVEEKYLNMDQIDQNDMNDPHQCAVYAGKIHENLLIEENRFIPKPGYMDIQSDINEKMRAILIDWLVEVHLKFKLVPETLYLTVNLIDRYLEKEIVMREKL